MEVDLFCHVVDGMGIMIKRAAHILHLSSVFVVYERLGGRQKKDNTVPTPSNMVQP